MCSSEIFYEEKSILILKTKAKLLPYEFYTIFRSEATGVEEESKEQQRTPKNRANPNADLMQREMNTYRCSWTVVEHRRFLDQPG